MNHISPILDSTSETIISTLCAKILHQFAKLRILICRCLVVNALLALPCFQIRLFQNRQNWNHWGTRAWKPMLNIRGSFQKIWKNTKWWTHYFVMIPPVKILLSLHLSVTQRSWHQTRTNKIFIIHPNNKFLYCIHGDIKTIFNHLLLLFHIWYINLQYKI